MERQTPLIHQLDESEQTKLLALGLQLRGGRLYQPRAIGGETNHGDVLLPADLDGLLGSAILMLDVMKIIGDSESVESGLGTTAIAAPIGPVEINRRVIRHGESPYS